MTDMIVLYDSKLKDRRTALKNLYFIVKTFFALNSFASRTLSCETFFAESIHDPLNFKERSYWKTAPHLSHDIANASNGKITFSELHISQIKPLA